MPKLLQLLLVTTVKNTTAAQLSMGVSCRASCEDQGLKGQQGAGIAPEGEGRG